MIKLQDGLDEDVILHVQQARAKEGTFLLSAGRGCSETEGVKREIPIYCLVTPILPRSISTKPGHRKETLTVQAVQM